MRRSDHDSRRSLGVRCFLSAWFNVRPISAGRSEIQQPQDRDRESGVCVLCGPSCASWRSALASSIPSPALDWTAVVIRVAQDLLQFTDHASGPWETLCLLSTGRGLSACRKNNLPVRHLRQEHSSCNALGVGTVEVSAFYLSSYAHECFLVCRQIKLN